MKNKCLLILVLLMFPFAVLAATSNDVASVTATSSGSTVNYEGTTEGEVHAVMCKLYDESGEPLDMLSSSVEDASFEGSFTNVAEGTYEVACARYESGVVKRAEVVVGATTDEGEETSTEEATTGKTAKSPQTGDKVMLYAAGLMLGIIGLVVSMKVYRKN